MSSLNAQFSVSYQPVAKATSKKVRGSRWLPRPSTDSLIALAISCLAESAPHNPANKASFEGVAAIRLISHSMADCGGIWLKPRRSV